MKIKVTIDGIRPMLQHNGRLANPLDPHTQALKELTGKRKKTDDDLLLIRYTEARGAVYETDDELLGFPTENVWRCIFDAAKFSKQGQDVKRALVAAGEMVVPLLVAGEPVKVADFLADDANIDYRPVKVQTSRTMRARPIVRSWSFGCEFELLSDVLDPRDLFPILERAGRLVGLGDWRPTYGTFTAQVGT